MSTTVTAEPPKTTETPAAGAGAAVESRAQGWNGETGQNHLYKPFVRGAILTVLTVGCTLGAANLAVMGFGADLGAVWTPLIQAHGYAQVFGWVGLFIMGVAYHTLPRFYLRPLSHPRMALPAFALSLFGVGLRVVAQPFAAGSTVMAWLLVVSSVAGVAGITLFAWSMFDTMRRGADRFGSPATALFIGAGFVWLWVGQAATLGVTLHLAATGQDAIPPALDAPYLRAVLSGAIVTTVLGYTLRTVPHMLKLPLPPVGPLRLVFGGYTFGVLTQIAAEAGFAGEAGRALGLLGASVETGSLLCFVALSGVFNLRALRTTHLAKRNPWPERFVRAAYFWLLVASSLNLAFSLSALAGKPAPHAFVASYHHALTVGFISTMIVGMSMRLLPVFIGEMNRRTRLAGVVFVLLTLGNATRVVSESLAHVYGGGFYIAMGLSGLVEVCALALYGAVLWKAMARPSYGQG